MNEEVMTIVELIRKYDPEDVQKFPYASHYVMCIAARKIERMSAQLEQVTKERDALLDELKGECDVCANKKDCTAPKCRRSTHKECEECPCRTCIIDTNWKWEGVEVD